MKVSKPKKCKECGTLFMQKSTLHLVCSLTCFLKYRKKKEVVKAKKEKKDWYEENKTLGQWENEAKKVFQKWIRLRDANLPCQACGTNKSNEWHAGHLYKAEIYSGVIFDERNVHICCKKCNVFLGGNELNYRANLVKRFGVEWVEKLESDAHATRNRKYTKYELNEIKKKYLELIKEFDS